MYTIERLKEQFSSFHEKALKDPHFKSEIKPLFNDNGSFNPDNWISRQDDIRTRLSNVGLSPGSTSLINIESADQVGTVYPTTVVLSHVYFLDDQWYISISIICEDTVRYDSYIVSWYKDRGCTEMITRNGHPINIDEYVSLLSTLEEGKFFDPDSWD